MVRRFVWLAACGLLATAGSQAAGWQAELIDRGGSGRFSSLKVDRDGNAHVVWVAEDGRESLKYGFWDHKPKKWFTMKIAEHASFTALALDSHGRPHISWADAGSVIGCRLRYARWDGSEWHSEAVPLNADTIAYYTSIALDMKDAPSISFYEYDGPRGSNLRVRMRVATLDGKIWQVRTVDGQNQSGKFNALAADGEGRIHLAYANVNAGTAGTRYARRNAKGEWDLELVDGREQNDLGYVGYAVAIAVDRAGTPHLTYNNYSTPAVKYAVRRDGRWQVEVVEQLAGGAYPDRNAIALDDAGRPYLAYFDAGQGLLRIAHKKGDAWAASVVDENGCGFTSSLAISQDTLWISYADEANRGLKVARLPLAELDGAATAERTDAAPATRGR
jgi:hypothetical protein